jgi:hypothetical protein
MIGEFTAFHALKIIQGGNAVIGDVNVHWGSE